MALINLAQYTIKPLNSKEKSIYNIPVISDTIKISDSRLLKDFKDQTFGGYKLAQASSALERAILEDKIEPALHWTLQLYLSGIIMPLWTKLLTIASKSINISNPQLPEFLYNKTKQLEHIIDNGIFNKDNILLLRNHPSIRLLFAELITILCLSRKTKLPTLPRINKHEFIIDNFKAKLEAQDNQLVINICNDDDPSEIRIAINEMALHIKNRRTHKALYWLNWILEWEKINSKKYGKYECSTRPVEGVDGKYFKDIVWLIWSVINRFQQHNQILFLYKTYTHKFTPAARTKKLPLIIWAILYITEHIDNTIALVDRPQLLFQSLLGFDKIVMNLKSQEVHYLVNKDLVNVIIENNYIKPSYNHKAPTLQPPTQPPPAQQLPNTLARMNDMYKLDRMMYS